jgi:hypothetical protein
MLSETIGFVLIAVGLIMLAFTGFNYVITEKVANIGPLPIRKKKIILFRVSDSRSSITYCRYFDNCSFRKRM